MKVLVSTVLMVIMLSASALAGPVGSVAPDFTLPDLDGKTVSLQQFRGKVVFLDFWAPWCPSCKEEITALDALYRKHRSDGLVMLGIDMDTSEDSARDFLKKTPVAFTILIDSKGRARRDYRIRSLPSAVLIGKDGKVRYIHLGYEKEFLQMYEKEIAELLQQP
jgi:peroxiredoxin